MHRWTVGNLKGGTAKTTTAVALALAVHEATGEDVVLIDADTGADGASQWPAYAGDDWPAGVRVVRAATLVAIERAASTTAHVVIDTGPEDTAVLRTALMVTDRLVLPLAPTGMDVIRLQPTVDLGASVAAAREDDLALSVVLVRVISQTRSSRDVREALSGRGLPLAQVTIPQREAVARAVLDGRGKPATQAYQDLAEELMEDDNS